MNSCLKMIFPFLAATLLILPTQAGASLQMATDFGCLSCHGAYRRGEAPTFERLIGKLSKFKGDAAAEAKFVSKYHIGQPFEHVDAHERISLETAAKLVHWLVEGGK